VRFGRFWIDIDLFLKGWIAFQRIAVATGLLVGHAAFQWTLRVFFAPEFQKIEKLLNIVESVAFVTLTAALLIEAVRIFLPAPLGINLGLEEAEATAFGDARHEPSKPFE